MKRFTTLLSMAALLVLCTLPAAAQSGCINSPENPTAILLVVGAAGALASRMRMRRRAPRTHGSSDAARKTSASR